MSSIIDLHIHTSKGSMDSGLTPPRMVEQARALGLRGMALAEHDKTWPQEEVDSLCQESGLLIINAREWSTNLGHIIVLGLDPLVRNIMQVQQLHEVAQAQEAFMIMAHPFRYFPGPSNFLFGTNRNSGALTVEELARHPVFELVNTLEVLNAGSTEAENERAQAVAAYLGKRGTGGSDAHMTAEVGRYATAFERDIKTQAELLAELLAGRFYPVRRTADGVYEPLEQAIAR
jgi:predicted metal-dependent phosphoesterase TrpH